MKCDAYLKRWLNDKSTIFSWVFRVLKDAGEGGLHVLDICSRIAKQTDISALTGIKSQHDAIGMTCRNFPLVFATVGKKEGGRYRIAEAYLPVTPKRHCPAETVPPKRVKRAWEDGVEPQTGCAKVRGHQFTLSFTHLPFDLSVSPAEADTRSHHTTPVQIHTRGLRAVREGEVRCLPQQVGQGQVKGV